MAIKLPGFGWRYLLYPVIGLVVANLVFQVVLGYYQLHAFRRADPVLLLVAVGNQLIAYLVVVPAMQSFFDRCGIRMSSLRTFGLVSAGLALAKVFPAGDYVYWRTSLKGRHGSVNATTQWTIMFYLWMVAGLVLTFFIFELATLALYPNSAATTLVGKLRYLPFGVTLLILFFMLLARWSWVKGVLSKAVFDRLGSRAVSPAGIIRDRHLGWHELRALTVASVGVWLIESMTLYLCLQAVGVPVPVVIAIFGFAFARLFELLPLVPGGIGQVEAGSVLFFAAYGFHIGWIFTATVLYRLITYWPPIIIGVICHAGLKNASLSPTRSKGRLDLVVGWHTK